MASIRLGRITDDSEKKRPRPLKVILGSSSDRDKVLQAAKFLRNHAMIGCVHISKYFSKEEMEKLKQARIKCNLMNEQTGAQPSDKKPYFITDGKIMIKKTSGKLKHNRDSATSKDSSSDGNISSEAKTA